MFRRKGMQGVERETLSGGERRQGRRPWSGWRACDAGAGEVDEDAAGEMVAEGDRAGIEGLGGGRAWRRQMSAFLVSDTAEKGRYGDSNHVDAGRESAPDHRPLAAKSVRKIRSKRRELPVYSGRVG